MSKENITLDELAQMVARGFEKTATKTDLEQLATKTELGELRKETKEGFEALDLHISSLGLDTI